MHVEIQVALNFLISFLYNKLPRRRVNQFAEELEQIVRRKFDGHWYPEEPYKGSAYRCIHCNPLLDSSLFREAAQKSGLNLKDVQDNLPHELSVWIDPGEVSYRISEKSPVIILYGSPKMNRLKPNAELGLNPEAQCFRPIVVSSSANGNNNTTTMMMMFENNNNNIDKKLRQFAMNNHQNKISDEHASTNANQPTTVSVANATPPTPPAPINVLATFNAKQEPITFTTAAFAATKFGSTKPKTQICKKGYPRTTMPMAMNENSNNHHLQSQFNNSSKLPPRKCLNNALQPGKDMYHSGGFKNRSFNSNNANNNSAPFATNSDAFLAYNTNNSHTSHQHQQLSALLLDNKKANRNMMMVGWPSINQETVMKNDNDDESTMSMNGLMMCTGDGPNNNVNGLSSLEQLLANANPTIDHVGPPKMKNIDTTSNTNDYIDQYDFYKYFLPHNTNNNEQMLDDSSSLVTPHFTANNSSEDDSNFSINKLTNFLGGTNIDVNVGSDTLDNVPFMADQLLREIFDMATNDNLNINHNKNDDENNDPNHHHHQRQVPHKLEQNVLDRNTETSNDLIDCGSGFTLSSSSWSSNELSSSAIINEFDNLSLNSNSSSSLGSVSSYIA